MKIGRQTITPTRTGFRVRGTDGTNATFTRAQLNELIAGIEGRTRTPGATVEFLIQQRDLTYGIYRNLVGEIGRLQNANRPPGRIGNFPLTEVTPGTSAKVGCTRVTLRQLKQLAAL